jgi:hypothetical protein
LEAVVRCSFVIDGKIAAVNNTAVYVNLYVYFGAALASFIGEGTTSCRDGPCHACDLLCVRNVLSNDVFVKALI